MILQIAVKLWEIHGRIQGYFNTWTAHQKTFDIILNLLEIDIDIEFKDNSDIRMNKKFNNTQIYLRYPWDI